MASLPALRPGGLVNDVIITTQALPAGNTILAQTSMVLLPSRNGLWHVSVRGRIFIYNPAPTTATITISLFGSLPNDMPDQYIVPITTVASAFARTLTYNCDYLLADGATGEIVLYVNASAAGISVEALNSQSQVISALRVRAFPL